ncbi:hypothetical protein LCI18_014857 [Fusarium solani-melongenae]|uniref:Uncharacterized protein n=1 Tax=Fusarium solani subsp. cucurbitae TaxID=2747967 RepID=A0ACD3ZRT9_FUSSC|nr:hypothetical protein LCI18_014857 [Fusarium solani-melongenae]
MKLIIGIALLSLFPTWASCLSKRSCASFEPQGKYGNKGYTVPSLKTFRTSEYINCTTELAREKGEDDVCEVNRYNMGLTLNSTVNVSVSDIQSVLDAVKEAASSDRSAKIDLNETVLVPFRISEPGIPAGEAGYLAFTPIMRCWEGLLGDCSGDDEKLDGTVVEACGYEYDDHHAVAGEQMVVGKENVVQSNSDELKGKPQPTWEEAQEEAEKEKDSDSDEKDKDKDSGNSASTLTGNVLGSGIWGCVVWTVMGTLWGLL